MKMIKLRTIIMLLSAVGIICGRCEGWGGWCYYLVIGGASAGTPSKNVWEYEINSSPYPPVLVGSINLHYCSIRAVAIDADYGIYCGGSDGYVYKLFPNGGHLDTTWGDSGECYTWDDETGVYSISVDANKRCYVGVDSSVIAPCCPEGAGVVRIEPNGVLYNQWYCRGGMGYCSAFTSSSEMVVGGGGFTCASFEDCSGD